MRKSISARTRFEIFKRDFFTCQYCGQKPPTVILHIDHIVPVVENGSNEYENLVTSCMDCNLGKSSVPLSLVVQPLKEKIKIERERIQQLAQYNQWLKEIQELKDLDFKSVSDALICALGEDPEQRIIAGNWAISVRSILKRLPSQKIIEAVRIADDRFSFKFSTYKTFKYFCGICWRMVDRNEGGQS